MKQRARMAILACAVVCLLSGCAAGVVRSEWREPFTFVVMADPQFGMWSGNQGFAEETALFEKAITAVNRLKPAFVAVCGDLIHRTGDEAQAKELFRIAEKLDDDIPIHWVAGNHDVRNEPSGESLAWYREKFGRDWYSFGYGGCVFFVLNSTIIQRPEKVPEEVDRQWHWLQGELDNAVKEQAVHIVVFQHHPLFVVDPDEDDQYFNIPRERRMRYLALFQKHDVAAVFAGHYHRNAHGRSGNLEMVTSGPVGKPLGDDPSGFTIVTVFSDHLEHAYHALDAVPAAVQGAER